MKSGILFLVVFFGMVFPACRAGEPSVYLVKGTGSTPNEAERNYAQSLARKMGGWLSDLNVPFAVVDDEQMEEPIPSEIKIIILSYNPFPSEKETAVLKTFVKERGKLAVFFGADERIADIMGVRIGKFFSEDTPGRWSGIRFNPAAPPHLPEVVFQQSWNIRAVVPLEGKGKVIAFWEDQQGKRLNDPAVVQTDHGFWMTHVLLDDMDVENKKQMLLGLIAFYDPDVWSDVAAIRVDQCCKIGPWKTFEELEKGLVSLADRKGNADMIKRELTRAREAFDRVNSFHKSKKYPEAVDESRKLRDLLIRTYGLVQTGKKGEIRAVWDHSGTGLYPGQWDKTCEALKKSGFSDVFCNVLWPAQAHYPSRIVPQSKTFEKFGDQAEQVTDAARRQGLKAHAWKVCWNLEGAGAEMLRRLKEEGRLQVTEGGQTINWLCPANIENLKYEKDAVRELLQKYAFDGIHLDYIRFRDSKVCYCATCREKFEKSAGKVMAKWPADVQNGALRKEFYRWRCEQISRYVRDIAAIAREARPGIKISAAVYGKYPSCVDAVGQEWAAWLGEGVVDFVCPMNYTTDPAKFSDYLKNQASLAGTRGKIIPGIGVTAMESVLNPAQVIDQIQMLREAGLPGFALFDLNKALEQETLPILRLGTTSE